MRYEYPTNGTTRSFELVKAVVLGLLSVSAITDRVDTVFRNRLDADVALAKGIYFIVRELRPIGGRRIQASQEQRLVIQVQLYTPRDKRNPDEFHAALQDDVTEYLLSSNFDPTLEYMDVSNPIHQVREAEQPLAHRDLDKLFSTSEYQLVILPKA